MNPTKTENQELVNTQEKQTEMKEEKLLCPKAGTATSSPVKELSSHLINTTEVAFWMKKNAYEPSTNKGNSKMTKKSDCQLQH